MDTGSISADVVKDLDEYRVLLSEYQKEKGVDSQKFITCVNRIDEALWEYNVRMTLTRNHIPLKTLALWLSSIDENKVENYLKPAYTPTDVWTKFQMVRVYYKLQRALDSGHQQFAQQLRDVVAEIEQCKYMCAPFAGLQQFLQDHSRSDFGTTLNDFIESKASDLDVSNVPELVELRDTLLTKLNTETDVSSMEWHSWKSILDAHWNLDAIKAIADMLVPRPDIEVLSIWKSVRRNFLALDMIEFNNKYAVGYSPERPDLLRAAFEFEYDEAPDVVREFKEKMQNRFTDLDTLREVLTKLTTMYSLQDISDEIRTLKPEILRSLIMSIQARRPLFNEPLTNASVIDVICNHVPRDGLCSP